MKFITTEQNVSLPTTKIETIYINHKNIYIGMVDSEVIYSSHASREEAEAAKTTLIAHLEGKPSKAATKKEYTFKALADMSTPEATRERLITIVTDFFNHRLSTKPEEKIVKLIKQRWAAIGELTEEEWRAMFLRYMKHKDEYRRRDLQTFLNNFSTEVSLSLIHI